jgi:hypothetical protein
MITSITYDIHSDKNGTIRERVSIPRNHESFKAVLSVFDHNKLDQDKLPFYSEEYGITFISFDQDNN